MPSRKSFLERAVSSRILSPDDVETVLERCGDTVDELAVTLIQDGLLSRWQVDEVLSNRAAQLLLADRYVLVEPLGCGAMGCVFLGTDLNSNQKVAIRHGIIHRDIKPSNIFITPEGTVKLLDLGLARLTETTQQDLLTRAGVKLGTVGYMAPEQADDSRGADARSDIYSLGCTLYALLAGSQPFKGHSDVEVLLKHASEPIPPISGVDESLFCILQKSLAKNPDDRFQTPSEFLVELQQWQVEWLRQELRREQASFDSEKSKLENQCQQLEWKLAQTRERASARSQDTEVLKEIPIE